MTLHRKTGTPRRLRHSGAMTFHRLSALGLALLLISGCGTTGPTPTAPTTVSPSGPVVVPTISPLAVGAGAPDQTMLPVPLPRVADFETNGDESDGWWWLRDTAGAQQASWTIGNLTPSGQEQIGLRLLNAAATDGSPDSVWLRYGPVVEGQAPDIAAGKAVLITLSNMASLNDDRANVVEGSAAIAVDPLPGVKGIWVRLSRVGPDGSVLPGQLAVNDASLSLGVSNRGPVPPPPPLAVDASFDSNGDEISGWWWLRDSAGDQRAGWGFFGVPTGDPIRIDFDALATDTINGGRDVDARFWLTYRTIVEGGGGGPLSEPRLTTLKNLLSPDDPLGYRTAGSFTVPTPLDSGAIGFWIGISRRGPDGQVLSGHVAVNGASAHVSGLGGSLASPAPTSAPSPTPDGGHPYGPLTITTACQNGILAPITISGQGGQNPHIEFSADESFWPRFTNDSYVIAPPNYVWDSFYAVSSFPNGIWVRWAADPSVKAFATNKGWCQGSSSPTPSAIPTPSAAPTATPSPTPAPTWGPPDGLPTVVALGDSYISGEAGRWAGNASDWFGWVDAGQWNAYYDNPGQVSEAIAGCHRSKAAEVHFDRGGFGHVLSINLACSGATTQTRDTDDGDKPGVDNCPNDIHSIHPSDCPSGIVGQTTALTAEARDHNVKLVVLSIGGNDFEFSNTVAQCVGDHIGSSYFYDTDYCHDDGSVLARFTNDNILAVRIKLVRAYEDVRLAMRAAGYPDTHWSLLIQNYPSPLPPGNKIRYGAFGLSRFNNGCPFWNQDADWANATALPTITDTIKAAIARFSTDYPEIDVHFMDVSKALDGHRLCEGGVDQVGYTNTIETYLDPGASDGSEWVAQIRGIFSSGGLLPIPGSVYYKNESFRPNYWGQLALRNCLRSAWNNGNVRGGRCEFLQEGLGAFGEPQMILSQY